MPTAAYPPGPGTMDSGTGVMTISAYLNNPEWIQRRLASITDQQFVGDRILRGRWTSTSGMAAYEVYGESPEADRQPAIVAPGAEFPLTSIGVPVRKLEAINKVGLATYVTLESVAQSNWMPVDRAERKLAMSVVAYWDSWVMAKVEQAVSDMLDVEAAEGWLSDSPKILADIMAAARQLIDMREGYQPDTLLVSSSTWVTMASDERFLSMLRKLQGSDGQLDLGRLSIPIPGGKPLEILLHPDGYELPPIVYDSTRLGGIVRSAQVDGAEDAGIAVTSKYYSASEKSPAGGAEVWYIVGKRARLPIVQEPQAACIILGHDEES